MSSFIYLFYKFSKVNWNKPLPIQIIHSLIAYQLASGNGAEGVVAVDPEAVFHGWRQARRECSCPAEIYATATPLPDQCHDGPGTHPGRIQREGSGGRSHRPDIPCKGRRVPEQDEGPPLRPLQRDDPGRLHRRPCQCRPGPERCHQPAGARGEDYE